MAGTWSALTHQPTFNTSTMFLLTDGRIMVNEEATTHWHALAPDDSGSYVNGTWSELADMGIWRRYYASGMLKDGRLIIVGGEQNGDGVIDTNKGEIYDPVADTWTAIPTPPGWPLVGDASSCILPDGRLMIGGLLDGRCIIYNPTTNAWTNAATKAIRANEETWILQPDDTIIAPQCWSPFQSEKYVIASDAWQNEGAPAATLVDPVMNEIGAGMLCYTGRTIFFGSASVGGVGKTSVYSRGATATATGSWAAGPDIPTVGGQTMVCNDCPASLLPNGKVLVTGAQFLNNDWGNPIHFFEYNPATNTMAAVPDPSNNVKKLYWSRQMLLPTGQVMFSPSTNNVQVYTPDGGPQEAWRPTITAITPHTFGFFTSPDYYLLQGTQLNGLSQANTYGDDCQPGTNYPLIRMTDTSTHHVFYARTYDFSTMGVATGAALQSCRFKLFDIPYGNYDLCVIANGISSHCQAFAHNRPNKPYFIDHGLKEVFEHYGKIVFEGDPFKWRDWVVDPVDVVRLKQQVKQLQNSVNRLNSLIGAKQLPRVGQEVANEASKEKPKHTE
ncbi:MAG: hypothetical protein ABJD07_10520 [Gemmatimonadaceae bacterium]